MTSAPLPLPRGAAPGSAAPGVLRRLRTFTTFTAFTSVSLAATHQSFVNGRESASLPSRAGLRKPDDLARHFFGRLALGVQLRVRLEVKRLALLEQDRKSTRLNSSHPSLSRM